MIRLSIIIFFGVLQSFGNVSCLFDGSQMGIHARTRLRRMLAATPYGPTPYRPGPDNIPVSDSSPPSILVPTPVNPFPTFSNQGGPPDVTGAWQTPVYIGLAKPSGFASTIFLGNGQYQQQMGRYLSWECTGNEGEYIATTIRRDTYKNGTIIVNYRCEVGQVTLGSESVWNWNSSDVACPDPNYTQYSQALSLKRINSSSLQPPATHTCAAGTKVSGMDTSAGPGLDRSVPIGIMKVPSIPPALQKSDFPPTYATVGGPVDATGIWFSDASTTGELNDGKAFSSVALQTDDTYVTVMGRWNSNECSGPGSYLASLSYTLSNQDTTTINGVGCTSGTVDLNVAVYKFETANPTTCPQLTEDSGTTMKRAGESSLLPTATQQTCM